MICARNSREEKIVMLIQVYLFDGLSKQELATIERHTVIKRYRKNTVIIEKDDDANALYILRQGQVKAYVADENGKEIILSQQGPGAILGELALLADIPRTASVMTLENCEFLVLTKRSFLQCVQSHPNIALNLIRALAKQVQSLTESVTDFALLDVYGRIAKILRDSAEEEDGRMITPKFTHQQIADRVGASREMVSKILKDLKLGGYLSSDGKRYVLHRALPAKW
jgi:CRP/FNR family cyclic AMP-dependent transcriptional regulator